MREQAVVGPLIFASSGLIIWAAHFTVVYAFNSVVCTRNLFGVTVGSMGLVPFGVALATIIAVGATAMVALVSYGQAGRRSRTSRNEDWHHFLRILTIWVAGLASLAIIWQAIPAFIVPACA